MKTHYRHTDDFDNRRWKTNYSSRNNPMWVLRAAEECMLGRPVSYIHYSIKDEVESFSREINPSYLLWTNGEDRPVYMKDFFIYIVAEPSLSYKENFYRKLEKNNKFTNTIIWC